MNKNSISIATIIIITLVSGYLLLNKIAHKTQNAHKKVIVKVGVLAPLSGENATYGDATIKGIELALDEISKKDEYSNFKIKLIKEDTKLEAVKAVNGIQKLISIDKVPVIIGPFGSSEVLAVSQIANQERTPIISASATADAISDAGDYVFRIVPSNKEQGISMANFVMNQLHIKNSIVVLALNNDYGVSLSNSFKKQILEHGGRIVYEDKFNEKEKDFKTLIVKIKRLNPKFVYIPDHYNEVGIFLRQVKEYGLKCVVGGGDGSYSPDLITVAGDGADSFYLTLMGLNNTNPNTEIFKNEYRKKYNKEFDVYSAYAYDCMFLIASAIKNISPDELSKIDGEKMCKLLTNVRYDGITGLNRFDEKGEVEKHFNIYRVKDSVFNFYID